MERLFAALVMTITSTLSVLGAYLRSSIAQGGPYLRKHWWAVLLAYAIWWGPFVMGLLAPVSSHTAALQVHIIRQMYHSHQGIEGFLNSISLSVVRIILSNWVVVAVLAGAVYLIRTPKREWFSIFLGVLGLSVILVQNLFMLFMGGSALVTMNGGSFWRGLFSMPHGFLEFAAYAVPMAILFGGLRTDHRTALQIVVGCGLIGALILIPSGIVEQYLSPIIDHTFHLRY